jgi:hypothetical protein
MWIEHPDGKVVNYSNRIEENSITFDPDDDRLLIVNASRFPIVKRARTP